MIFHLALAADLEAARAAGRYTVSTRGASLAEVGFVHCSTEQQWRGVRERFYPDVPAGELVLLSIDPAGLDVRYEPPAPVAPDGAGPASSAPDGSAGGSAESRVELFPHVYGPIPIESIVAVDRIG